MDWDQERSIADSFLNAIRRRSVFWVFTAGAGFVWILSLVGAAPLGLFGLALFAIGLLWAIYAEFRELSLVLRSEDHGEAARIAAHWHVFSGLDIEYRNRRMPARHRDDPDLIEFFNRLVEAWTAVRSDIGSGAIFGVGMPFDEPVEFATLRSMESRQFEARLAAAVVALDRALKSSSWAWHG
jgi:hypothetical protein